MLDSLSILDERVNRVAKIEHESFKVFRSLFHRQSNSWEAGGLHKLVYWRVLLHQFILLNKIVQKVNDVVIGACRNRVEVPYKIEQISILEPDRLEILFLSVFLNSCEFGLELKSVSHLLEEEGQEEVSPIVVELIESGNFILDD